ncbi:hypothetical protein QZH41_006136 [Actinostola sp. cb2023]|nr:hypothetical protein QZH41_006136 [Actinostola sp. cb2023]
MAERNPSPPRLSAEERELIESDNIGDTVFSKKWVLGTLMKLVERINSESEKDDRGNQAENEINNGEGHNETAEEEPEEEENADLEDEFDSDLCELWDMSMNKEPTCVSNMLAPHHKMLQKIVHYSKRIDSYQDMVADLVGATLSVQELTSLHESLMQVNIE